MRKFFFWVIAFIPLLIAVEVSSWLLLRLIPTRIQERSNYRRARDYIEAAQKAAFAAPQIRASSGDCRHPGQTCTNQKIFSRELGWRYPPNFVFQDQEGVLYRHGQYGERITSTNFAASLISSYGDSFTHCNEVQDDETWQTFLAHKLGKNILNFGVAGYGPDQAFLQYAGHRGLIPRTPLVMLCIFPENINRVVNVYRNFYMYSDPMSLTKPRFRASNGTITLIENPIRSADEMQKLSSPSFVEQIGSQDYWYQFGVRLPVIRFPYMLSVIEWREIVVRSIKASLCRKLPGFVAPAFNLDLYLESEPLATICGIVDNFVAAAREMDQYPIIVVIPHTDYVREVLETGATRSDPMVAYMKSRDYVFIDLVRDMADLKPSLNQLQAWYRGHATVEGNRVTAQLISRFLHERVKTDAKLEELLLSRSSAGHLVVGDKEVVPGR